MTPRLAPNDDSNVNVNEVFAQDPGAGADTAKAASITLTASSGPTKVTIPDVAGKSSTDAANQLGQAGFKTATQSQPSDSVPTGDVIGTNPPAGSQANKGSTVAIIVSSGKAQVVVPSVQCLDKAGADATIKAAGLNPKSSGPADGFATTQNPAANSKADTGSDVSYTLVSPKPPACGGTTTTTSS